MNLIWLVWSILEQAPWNPKVGPNPVDPPTEGDEDVTTDVGWEDTVDGNPITDADDIMDVLDLFAQNVNMSLTVIHVSDLQV